MFFYPILYRSDLRKIDRLACCLLIASALGSLVFVVYISFLWFASSDNKIWKTIAIAGWMSRSIAIAAVVLRSSVTGRYFLFNACRYSTGRPWHLSFKFGCDLYHASGVSSTIHVFASCMVSSLRQVQIVFQSCCSAVGYNRSLQFTSTVLLTDVGVAYVTR